jgi:hypothetical protein
MPATGIRLWTFLEEGLVPQRGLLGATRLALRVGLRTDQIGFANLSNRLFCLSGVRIRHAKLQAQDGVIQFFKIGAQRGFE